MYRMEGTFSLAKLDVFRVSLVVDHTLPMLNVFVQ